MPLSFQIKLTAYMEICEEFLLSTPFFQWLQKSLSTWNPFLPTETSVSLVNRCPTLSVFRAKVWYWGGGEVLSSVYMWSDELSVSMMLHLHYVVWIKGKFTIVQIILMKIAFLPQTKLPFTLHWSQGSWALMRDVHF